MKKIVNTCNIDTIYGNRSINIIKEDITESNDDLIIFSTHADLETPIYGEVYNSLCKKYAMTRSGKGKMSMEINGIVLEYWREKLEDKIQNFLMARISEFSQKSNIVEIHDKHVKAIFSSLKALEFNELIFENISLPIIAGNRNVDSYESIKILLKYSIKFLKESKNTETINFYFIEEEEEQVWNEAFEKTLGRTYYKQGSMAVIESLIVALQDRIEVVIDSGNFKEIEYPLRSIDRELDGVDSLSISNIAINSRKICEIIAKEVADMKNINIAKIKYDLSSILNVLASKDVLAPWVIQYLHTARVFGNKAAHVQSTLKYCPTKIFYSDFISILAALYNIIEFWYYNKEKLK